MRETEMIPQVPVKFARTKRNAQSRVLTSMDAGKIIPIRVEPVLREESVTGRVGATIEMMETPEVVSNAIHGTMQTWFVPYLAFDQFMGSLEELNRRYMKVESLVDQLNSPGVQPFFQINKYWNGVSRAAFSLPIENDANAKANHVDAFYKQLGLHLPKMDDVNCSAVQAYNAMVNHRRKARSPQLALRDQLDHSFAEAFWPMAGMQPVVAAYDDKLIAGEVRLRDLNFKAPIKSIGYVDANPSDQIGEGDPGTLGMGPGINQVGDKPTRGADGAIDWANKVWAEFSSASDSATMSLADIDQARKTAAFARLRTLYSGQTDEFIIDMLMQGFSVPLEMMKDPMLVGRSTGTFNFNSRYSTEAATLDESATTGILTLQHTIAVPQTTVGGILITTIEIAPERIWERAKDHFFFGVSDTDQLPNALVDYLDPEKVSTVTKDHLDVNHATPDAILGYRPKNSEWRRNDVRVGGKFFRPDNDAYTEDRARIWANEVNNPSLNTDFYLTTNLHKKVFADQSADGFEVLAMHDLSISTNVQFGDALLETDGTSDYAHITDQVDADQGTF